MLLAIVVNVVKLHTDTKVSRGTKISVHHLMEGLLFFSCIFIPSTNTIIC